MRDSNKSEYRFEEIKAGTMYFNKIKKWASEYIA
jgi:hypothetical protein